MHEQLWMLNKFSNAQWIGALLREQSSAATMQDLAGVRNKARKHLRVLSQYIRLSNDSHNKQMLTNALKYVAMFNIYNMLNDFERMSSYR